MPGEEVPRSEDTGRVVSAIAGGVAVVAGVVLLAIGYGAPVGGVLIAAGASGLAYGTGVTDKIILGTETWGQGEQITDWYQKNQQITELLNENGCFAELPACSVSSECPAGSSCSYGCCEALHSGLIAESDGVTTPYLVYMNVPANLELGEIAVWASAGLKVNDRAVVLNAAGGERRSLRPTGPDLPVSELMPLSGETPMHRVTLLVAPPGRTPAQLFGHVLLCFDSSGDDPEAGDCFDYGRVVKQPGLFGVPTTGGAI